MRQLSGLVPWYRCPYKLAKSLESTCEWIHFNENSISDVCSICKKINSFCGIKGILISSCISWILRILEEQISKRPFQWLLLCTTVSTSQLNKVIILGNCSEVNADTYLEPSEASKIEPLREYESSHLKMFL